MAENISFDEETVVTGNIANNQQTLNPGTFQSQTLGVGLGDAETLTGEND